jgi:hypothetical protein
MSYYDLTVLRIRSGSDPHDSAGPGYAATSGDLFEIKTVYKKYFISGPIHCSLNTYGISLERQKSLLKVLLKSYKMCELSAPLVLGRIRIRIR